MFRKKMAHRYKVIFEPEPDGSAWNVRIPAVKSCFTWGRSLAEARRSIREALAVCLDDDDRDAIAASAVFDEVYRLPPKVRAAVRKFTAARAKAEALKRSSADAARTLTETLSLRDAGELLGMSAEGVRKVLKTG